MNTLLNMIFTIPKPAKKEILKQFEELIDKINLNEIEVKERIKANVERFFKL